MDDRLYNQLKKKWKKIVKRRLLEETLRGEWWIDDSGSAVFADGDIVDMNHEAIVIENVTKTILGYFDIDDDQRTGDLSYYTDRIKENLKQKVVIQTKEQERIFDLDPEKYIVEYLKRVAINDFPGGEAQIKFAVSVAFGGNIDARDYAMKWYRWKRMKGNNIQTEFLTREDLKIIDRGISDAYTDQLEDNEDPSFNIEVNAKNHAWYENVPLSVIETLNPAKLHEYLSIAE